MDFVTYGLIALSLYLLVPIMLKLTPSFINYLIFLNVVCPPNFFTKLDQPGGRYSLKKVVSHVIKLPMGETIGVWEMKPTDESESSFRKVILYCHGNAHHRAFTHRLNLYQVFVQKIILLY